MKVFFYFIFVALLSAPSLSLGVSKTRQTQMPYVKGETYYIEGKIDRHIYDALAYERRPFTKVSLNSQGGSHDWALLIAERLRERGVDTVLLEEAFCASACVYIFGAGKNRRMHESAWVGIHGAHLSGRYIPEYIETCLLPLEKDEKKWTFTPELKGCEELLEKGYKTSLIATQKAFHLLEGFGVSANLFQDFLDQPQDPQWYQDLNILKKKDWVLEPFEALTYNLATEVLSQSDDLF